MKGDVVLSTQLIKEMTYKRLAVDSDTVDLCTCIVSCRVVVLLRFILLVLTRSIVHISVYSEIQHFIAVFCLFCTCVIVLQLFVIGNMKEILFVHLTVRASQKCN